ncbi:uncharacterized protein [Nothobranchius furzeri]|uniref:uncharacterized protein isoform X1 n=1 Tax=Nothobranchius furzeri TaxID=105023 RepID=UPI003904B0A8
MPCSLRIIASDDLFSSRQLENAPPRCHGTSCPAVPGLAYLCVPECHLLPSTTQHFLQKHLLPHKRLGKRFVQRQYDSDVNHREEQESPRNHHERQENPIYGNINTDRRGSAEDCYEMMTLQRTRESTKPSESDLNYASLNLKMAKKRKKHRHTQGQAQGRNKHQDQKPDHGTPPVNSFLELDADVDAHLPPRDISTMISYNSIYLNSQQIAQEAVELERERTMNMGMDILGWEGINQCDDDEGRRWEEGQHSEERKDDGSDGNACVLHIEAETSADAE